MKLAYLYGSTARGEEWKKSDIDIAVLLKDLKSIEKNPLYESRIAGELQKQTEAERDLDIRVLNQRDPVYLHQVLKYGDCIYSESEKEKAEFETFALKKYWDFKPKIEEYNRARARRMTSHG